jgi:hypothetical protein
MAVEFFFLKKKNKNLNRKKTHITKLPRVKYWVTGLGLFEIVVAV